MPLSPDDATAFFAVWSSLDAFVNRRASVVPGHQTPAECRVADMRALRSIREVLWRDPLILPAFVAENPDMLPADQLRTAAALRHAVKDRFYVERHLKAGSIFVSTNTRRVYVVDGVTERIADVLGRAAPLGLGVMLDTVLLAFGSGIVWDGIGGVLPVSFGPGVREQYREAYLTAKERGTIMRTLDGSLPAPAALKKGPDQRPAVEGVLRAAAQLGRPDNGLQAAAFKLLKSAAEVALVSLDEKVDDEQLVAELRALRRALKAVEVAIVRRG